VRRACAYLAGSDEPLTLTALARRIGGSPYHLQRNFTRLVGVSPKAFADACRLKKARRELRAAATVTDAAFGAGFGSSSRFYARAVDKLGMPPAAYKKGGAGMTMSYAIVASPLGELLVAATARGVCAVKMGSSKHELERALASEFPAATITPDAGALAAWTERILAHLAGRTARLDLPLDIRATAFQWQVWNALAAIPRGQTRTYADVAAAIGKPAAARAVARACATNPVALAIPCHRVVPAAGGIGGYRWGSERKQALLQRETASAR
jgi:AraC family transcriptional regulator of adaptative response/methylated-DNA-[protein]-cysteine methyltransferase